MSEVESPRRLGCVVPTALVGLAITVGGGSMVFDWWRHGGPMYIEFLLLSLAVGPGLVAFAIKVYRDPQF